jgi:hypothetical protein
MKTYVSSVTENKIGFPEGENILQLESFYAAAMKEDS